MTYEQCLAMYTQDPGRCFLLGFVLANKEISLAIFVTIVIVLIALFMLIVIVLRTSPSFGWEWATGFVYALRGYAVSKGDSKSRKAGHAAVRWKEVDDGHVRQRSEEEIKSALTKEQAKLVKRVEIDMDN